MHVAILCTLLDLSLPPDCLRHGLPSHRQCQQICNTAECAIRDLERLSHELWPAFEGPSWNAWARAQTMRVRIEPWGHCLRATQPGCQLARRLALRRLVERVGWRRVVTGELQEIYP